METSTRVDRLEEALLTLAAAEARSEARLEQFAAAQERTEKGLAQLTERVDALAVRMDQLTERVDALAVRMDQLTGVVGDMRGRMIELDYRAKYGAYFSPLARRLRLVDHSALADLLEDAVNAGQLSRDERLDVLRADIVLSGKRRQDGADAYVLVEVSHSIAAHDVERAAARAAALHKLGQPVVPAVAGQNTTPEVDGLAARLGVWRVVDGYDQPPAQAPAAG